MFLIQLASADDQPKAEMHKSPCNGLVLRGHNFNQVADLKLRHEKSSEKDPDFS